VLIESEWFGNRDPRRNRSVRAAAFGACDASPRPTDPTHPESLSDPLPVHLLFFCGEKYTCFTVPSPKLASTHPVRFASPRAALEEKKRPTETHSRLPRSPPHQIRRSPQAPARTPLAPAPLARSPPPSSRVNETTAGVWACGWGDVSRETTKSAARLRPRAHLHLTDLPHASFSPSQSPAGTARGCTRPPRRFIRQLRDPGPPARSPRPLVVPNKRPCLPRSA
jgi:hypothetical protein